MHEHDGYAPHSHEVRPDHEGVTRTAPVLDAGTWPRLAITGLPTVCIECGAMPGEWALTVYGGMLKVTCPKCWAVSLPVVAVRA